MLLLRFDTTMTAADGAAVVKMPSALPEPELLRPELRSKASIVAATCRWWMSRLNYSAGAAGADDVG